MASLNKASILGRVGKDPIVKSTNSGKMVATFSIATSEKYNGTEKTTWHNIVAWEKLAELCEKYVKSGKQLYIEGRIENRSYDDKDGQKKYISEIIARDMILLGDKSGGHAEPITTGADNNDMPQGDLPF